MGGCGGRWRRNNTLYQTQIYTTRMSALAAGTKHCTPPVGTTDHFHTKSARTNFTTQPFRRNSVRQSRLQIPDNPVVVVVDRDFFFAFC